MSMRKLDDQIVAQKLVALSSRAYQLLFNQLDGSNRDQYSDLQLQKMAEIKNAIMEFAKRSGLGVKAKRSKLMPPAIRNPLFSDRSKYQRIIELVIFEILPAIENFKIKTKTAQEKELANTKEKKEAFDQKESAKLREEKDATEEAQERSSAINEDLRDIQDICKSYLEANPKVKLRLEEVKEVNEFIESMNKLRLEAEKEVNKFIEFMNKLDKLLISLIKNPEQFSTDQKAAIEKIRSAIKDFTKKTHLKFDKKASKIVPPIFSDIDSYHNLMVFFILNVLPLLEKFAAKPDSELAKKIGKSKDEVNATDLANKECANVNGVLIQIENLCDSYRKKFPELEDIIDFKKQDAEEKEADKEVDSILKEMDSILEEAKRANQTKKDAERKAQANAAKKAKEEEKAKKVKEEAAKEASLTPEEREAIRLAHEEDERKVKTIVDRAIEEKLKRAEERKVKAEREAVEKKEAEKKEAERKAKEQRGAIDERGDRDHRERDRAQREDRGHRGRDRDQGGDRDHRDRDHRGQDREQREDRDHRRQDREQREDRGHRGRDQGKTRDQRGQERRSIQFWTGSRAMEREDSREQRKHKKELQPKVSSSTSTSTQHPAQRRTSGSRNQH